MYLTQSIAITPYHPHYAQLDRYAFLCKNLFNAATYQQRQRVFAENKSWLAFDLITQFSQARQSDYLAIPAKVAQQTIKQVAQNFTAFWKSIKAYKTNPEDFKGRPKLPKYLHKTDGRANAIFTKQAISQKDWKAGVLTLSSYFEKPLSFPLGKLARISFEQLQEVKLVRFTGGYRLNITYKVALPDYLHDNQRTLGIDLGLNNLMTIVSNQNTVPVIITGKPIKSFNQHFNKQRAKLQTAQVALSLSSDDTLEQTKIIHKLERLSRWRAFKLADYLHKSSRMAINYARSHQITRIVVGYNQGWKQGIELGKQNNQQFVQIPFLRLVEMLKYKGALVGIEVICHEESYTSKCSFLDGETPQKQNAYLGRRVKRGLFQSATGKQINADVNGALNILTKVIGKFYYDPITVCSTPRRLNPLVVGPNQFLQSFL